jgi:alpha-mannosidase
VALPVSHPVALPYNQAVASRDGSVSGGRFDSTGRSLPAEMLPRAITFGAIRFSLAPPDTFNAVIPRGQTIALPAGTYTRLYLLAAASESDQRMIVKVGETPVELTIQDWGGYIGQWDNRVWKAREEVVQPRQGAPAPPPGTPPRMRTVMDVTGLTPGFIKRTPVAWFSSHRHATDGSNDVYAYAYLYAYAIDVPAGAKSVTLPVSERVKILAMTVADQGLLARPAQPLYDTLDRK